MLNRTVLVLSASCLGMLAASDALAQTSLHSILGGRAVSAARDSQIVALSTLGIGVRDLAIFDDSARDERQRQRDQDAALNEAAARCPARPIPLAACEQLRKDAKEKPCEGVTPEEIDQQALDAYVPMCVIGDDGVYRFTYVWCKCGCFEPSTRLLTFDTEADAVAWTPVKDLGRNDSRLLFNLGREASFDDWYTDVAPIKDVVKGKEEEPLVVITTEDGAQLKLTTGHAVLLSNGELVNARDLEIGSELVTVEGLFVQVTNIEAEPFEGEVYNVETGATDELGHIIFAEGLAVGDLAWQNQLQNELYQIKIRQ